MARPKTLPTYSAAATPGAPAPNGTNASAFSAGTVETYYYTEPARTGGRGKSPSEKTRIIRAALAEFPNLMPKKLAEKLNDRHPNVNFKNIDISQQKLQLKKLEGEDAPKKAKEPKAAAPAAPAAPAPARSGTDVQHFAELARRLGTDRIRELCDLADYFSK